MKLNFISSGSIVIFGIVIIGFFIHGVQVCELGLYWDDIWLLMKPMHESAGDMISFIFYTGTEFLTSARPFSYFVWMINRVGFANSISVLHWVSVVLLVLNVVVMAVITRRIFKEKWFIFAVSVIFITYPLAPIVTIWPSCIGYFACSLLALLSILFFLHGLKKIEKRRLLWFALASMAYISSMLTYELCAFIPPAFVSLYILSKNKQDDAEWHRLGRMYFYRPAVLCMSLFVITLIAYVLWRSMILPSYINYNTYSTSEGILSPGIIIKKFLTGLNTVFFPWYKALLQIIKYPPPLKYIFFAGFLFVSIWAITLRLMIRSLSSMDSSLRRKLQTPITGQWLQACITGIVLVVAALALVSMTPYAVDRITGPFTRVNFAATIGIALGLPALLWFMVQSYNRANIIILICLVYLGVFCFPIDDGNIFSHKSASPVLFDRYSLSYGFVVIVYVAILILFALIIMISYTFKGRRIVPPSISDRLKSMQPLISVLCFSGTIACLVFIGSLFHFSAKQQFVVAWNQYKTMYKQLQNIAPVLDDDTFVIIDTDKFDHLFLHGGKHKEFASFLPVLYDNSTLKGNLERNLRFYKDRVESQIWGRSSTGARLSYDQLLLFEFDGDILRMLPKIEVVTEEGYRLIVNNNPKRILIQAPVTTFVWRHVME